MPSDNYGRIDDWRDELIEWRRDFHRHPELAFEEERTAGIVAERLRSFGVDVHEGIAKTGVIGTIRAGSSDRAVALRADMDALPIDEKNQFGHRSTVPGKMHACGHDGHTAMLLGAARYLAETRNFDGTVQLIFQPAEEKDGGAGVMVREGLFERFPADKVFGLHNFPGVRTGAFATNSGPFMAAIDQFEIEIRGRGTHGAWPQSGIDPIVAASQVVLGLQTLVSRNVDPRHGDHGRRLLRRPLGHAQSQQHRHGNGSGEKPAQVAPWLPRLPAVRAHCRSLSPSGHSHGHRAAASARSRATISGWAMRPLATACSGFMKSSSTGSSGGVIGSPVP